MSTTACERESKRVRPRQQLRCNEWWLAVEGSQGCLRKIASAKNAEKTSCARRQLRFFAEQSGMPLSQAQALRCRSPRPRHFPAQGFAVVLWCSALMSGFRCTSQEKGQMMLQSVSNRGFSLGTRQGVVGCHNEGDLVPPTPSPTAFAITEAGGIDREQIRQELFRSLQLTETGRLRICRLEQGTEEWLEARKNRLTGSNFGAAVGHNKFKSPAALAHDMLYSTFQGNDATRWGSDHEDLACQEYCLTRRSQLQVERMGEAAEFAVTHSGLNAHPIMTWMAVSPDGHIRENGEDGLLEIKCPYSQRIYPEIPPYYMDQIQGGMGVLGLAWADFCIWTPQSMQIQRVKFDRNYWEQHLKPGLEKFYHSVFVPAYVDREVRRRQGDLSVPRAPR